MIAIILSLIVLMNNRQAWAAGSESSVIDCASEHQNIKAQFVAYADNSVNFKIINTDEKSHICEINNSKFINGRKSVKSNYQIKFNIYYRQCTPGLPPSLSSKLRSEIVLFYDIWQKKAYLDWVSYSESLECVAKTDNLESYFSAQSKSKVSPPVQSLPISQPQP